MKERIIPFCNGTVFCNNNVLMEERSIKPLLVVFSSSETKSLELEKYTLSLYGGKIESEIGSCLLFPQDAVFPQVPNLLCINYTWLYQHMELS